MKTAEQLTALIDQLHAANAALQASESKYRIVADYTYDWEYWLDPDRGFVYLSPSCERITGYTPAEFQADPGLLMQIIHADDRPRWEAHHADFAATAPVNDLELRLQHRDGSEHWISHCCQPVIDRTGRFLGRRASNREITDRKLLSEALRLSERRFRALIENAADMITILDAEARVTYASPAVARVLGYSNAGLLGRNAFELVHPGDRERALQLFEDALNRPGWIFRVNLRFLHGNGRWHALEVVGRNLFHEPAVVGIVINARDITDRPKESPAAGDA